MGYKLGDKGSIPTRDKEIFLYSTVSGLALRPCQPHIQWILRDLSPEVMQLSWAYPVQFCHPPPERKKKLNNKEHDMGSLLMTIHIN
jgi:hypothetical protein